MLVAVIDNATASTPRSCAVNAASSSYCTNAGAAGSAAPGGRIELKLTAGVAERDSIC